MFWENNRPPSTVDTDSETETESITSFQAENFHRETLEDELTKLQLKNIKLESKYKAAKVELKNCRTQINELESKQCVRCKNLEAKLKESKALIGQYEIRNQQVEKDLQISRSQNSKLQNEIDQMISRTTSRKQEQGGVIQRIHEYLPSLSYEEFGFLNIEPSDLTIGKQLEKGSFGEVFECFVSTNDEMKLTIKFLKDKNNVDQRNEFDKEISFMKSLAHQYVDQLYG